MVSTEQTECSFYATRPKRLQITLSQKFNAGSVQHSVTFLGLQSTIRISMQSPVSILSHWNIRSLNTLLNKNYDATGKRVILTRMTLLRTGFVECFLCKSILLTYYWAAFEDCCLLALLTQYKELMLSFIVLFSSLYR